jgi:hypothetical protein
MLAAVNFKILCFHVLKGNDEASLRSNYLRRCLRTEHRGEYLNRRGWEKQDIAKIIQWEAISTNQIVAISIISIINGATTHCCALAVFSFLTLYALRRRPRQWLSRYSSLAD